jgi:hypothetical protein
MELPGFITHNIEILGVRELLFILFCDVKSWSFHIYLLFAYRSKLSLITQSI